MAIGRALMTNPDCLAMDEPPEGLALIKQEGMSILLVEQNAPLAMKLVDYVHVMSKGRVVYSAKPAELWANDGVKSRFLGLEALRRHCEPSGLAFGEPKGKLREAISYRRLMRLRIEIASRFALAMTITRAPFRRPR